VLAIDPACRAPAKTLARSVYARAELRPAIDEATARALVGEAASPGPATVEPTAKPPGEPAPPPTAEPEQTAPPPDAAPVGPAPETPTPAASPKPAPSAELSDVIRAIADACQSDCAASDVARRLIASLGRELGVALVVVVTCPGEQQAPAAASVMRVADEHFVPVTLTARREPAAAGAPVRWPDAVGVLRALVSPAAGPVAAKPPAPPPRSSTVQRPSAALLAAVTSSTADVAAEYREEEGSDWDLLTSPWFWGGLGVVLAAGVTVFALSQSSLDETDTVVLEGRVAP
jgi:hypothetical protein